VVEEDPLRESKRREGPGLSVAEIEQQLMGTVKWFNNQKGYGFICREEEADVFVHYSAIIMEGFRTLREGDVVTYQLCDGEKGPHAVNVAVAEA